MKIAIACSGLGHVHRGIEAWALDSARALRKAGWDVTLFRGAGGSEAWEEALPCLKRFDSASVFAGNTLRRFGGWRLGLGSAVDVEQTTFSYALWRRVRRDFDILHAHDAVIAWQLTRLQRHGYSRAKVIFGNGSGEVPGMLRRYRNLQHLTPAQQERWEPYRQPDQLSFLIPYFLDTSRFQPGDRTAMRAQWNLPEDAFVVLAVAAIRKSFKRVDYLIREFRRFLDRTENGGYLVIAGGREQDTDELMRVGHELLGAHVRFLVNLPREKMSALYQACDVFTITSLDEVFGIVFLEAMSCGIPVVVHDTPTSHWIVGPAGAYIDMRADGSLAEKLVEMSHEERRRPLAAQARGHVEDHFSEEKVVAQMAEMYRCVAEKGS